MDLSDYVGLPFEERGRTRAGIDCWGLVALVYRERLGIDLPSLDDRYTSVADRSHIASIVAGEQGPWREIVAGAERIGDGVLMTVQGEASHVGLVAGNGLILHIERGTGSLIERHRSRRLSARARSFFRHESFS